jgi:hypothetical protein
MAGLLGLTWWLTLGTMRPANEYFLAGFKDRIEKEVNLPAIRAWLKDYPGAGSEVPRQDWPAAIADLSPEYVTIDHQPGTGEARLLWGSGFMHWGLAVYSGRQPAKEMAGAKKIRLDEHSFAWVDSQ